MNRIAAHILSLLFVLTSWNCHAQCNYQTVDFDDFEFTGNDPYLIPGTVYHLTPQQWLPYSGNNHLYLNFVNNLPAGTVCYDRPYTVCQGQTYRFSVWLQEVWGGTNNLTLNVLDGAGNVLDTWTGIIVNGTWFNYQSNPVVAPGTTLRFQLISNGATGSNDLSMDDLSLEMCPIPVVNQVNLPMCIGAPVFDLYDNLSVISGNSGVWTGPSATSNGAQGTIDPTTATTGAYTYTVAGVGVCPDSVEIVNVSIAANPDIDDLTNVQACDSYILPPITGTGLSGAESYYTGTNGTGIPYPPGTIISTSQTLFIYDGIPGCDDEESFTITINNAVDAGGDAIIALCPTQATTDLFSTLLGSPVPGGTWTGPSPLGNGSIGTFDPTTMSGGTYTYVVQGGGACPNDTSTVTVTVQGQSIDLGNDTTLCPGEQLLLDAGAGFDSYLWQDGSVGQTYNVTADGQYWCQAGFTGQSLIFNGDFEMGDTLYSTDYIIGVGGPWGQLSNPGTYAVSTNTNIVHSNFQWCTDHTTGAGNMLIVNGASTPGTNVWCQTVNVQPNTDYLFSTWAMSVENTTNAAILQFSINGVNLGNTFSPSTLACNWQAFNQTWNSGAATTAQICIVNQNISGGGNDFAIDDIYFAPICLASDTINVNYVPAIPLNLGNDTSFCAGDSVVLDAQVPLFNVLWSDNSTNQTLTINSTGSYWAEVTDTAGCIEQDTINITVNPYPVVDLGPDTTICDQDTIVLDVSGLGQSYLWNDNSTSDTLAIHQTGTYWVAVDALGCVSADTMNLSIQVLPTVDLGNDTAFCEPNTITLDAQNAGLNYLWNDNSVNQLLTTGTTGTYWVDVIDALGCSTRDSIEVVVNPLPIVDLGPDTAICEDANITWDVTASGSSFLWNDNSTNASLTTNQAGQYWVEVNELGCTSTDTVNLNTNLLPVFSLGNDTTLCEPAQLILAPGIPVDTYLWQDGTVEPDFTVTGAGAYDLTVSTNGCEFSDQIIVGYIYLPIIDLPADTVLCEGHEYLIQPATQHATDYLWSSGSIAMDYDADRPETIWVEASNVCGVASDTMNVSIKRCDCFVYIPNTFTPNADGINDLFSAQGECDIIDFELMVFNRWGELLWTTANLGEGWDGTYMGTNVPVDTYVWKVQYNAYVDNVQEMFLDYGHVNVVR